MTDHFAAFSFVDRITALEPGARARGTFAVPGDLTAFPACLVAEAVGQLAAWVAMAKVDFRGRPVAALAAETIFHVEVAPGSRLDLAVEVESCDDEAIAYGGVAHVDRARCDRPCRRGVSGAATHDQLQDALVHRPRPDRGAWRRARRGERHPRARESLGQHRRPHDRDRAVGRRGARALNGLEATRRDY